MTEYFSLYPESMKKYFSILFEKYGFIIVRTEYGMGQLVVIENGNLIIRVLDDRGYGYCDLYIKSVLDKKYDFGEYHIYTIWEHLFKNIPSYKEKYPSLFQYMADHKTEKILFEMIVSFVNQEIDVLLSMFSNEKIAETKQILDEVNYERALIRFGKKMADSMKEAKEYRMKVELYRKNLPEQSSQE